MAASEKHKELWNRFLHVTSSADRVGIWFAILGPSGFLVTLFGFITQAFEPISRHGWAAVTLSSILLALVTLLVISLSLIAWRYFRSNLAMSRSATSSSTGARSPQRDFDSIFFLGFAVDLATIYTIDDLIDSAPNFSNLRSTSTDGLSALFDDCQKFIRRVSARFDGEDRAIDIRGILTTASGEAEQSVREIPQSERPSHIDPVDLPKYWVAERQ